MKSLPADVSVAYIVVPCLAMRLMTKNCSVLGKVVLKLSSMLCEMLSLGYENKDNVVLMTYLLFGLGEFTIQFIKT